MLSRNDVLTYPQAVNRSFLVIGDYVAYIHRLFSAVIKCANNKNYRKNTVIRYGFAGFVLVHEGKCSRAPAFFPWECYASIP